MKQAYLILAHNEIEVLRRLIAELDDVRNDIYVHWDIKSGEAPAIKTAHASLIFIDRRIDVRWGDISVVKAEYELFEEAVKNGPYGHYHLLSGVDLPVKSQDEIHNFFDSHPDTEFIGFSNYNTWEQEVERKVRRYHLFPRQFGKNTGVSFPRVSRSLFLNIQDLFARCGIKRNKRIDFRKGTQWISVTDGFARYMLSHKDFVMKTFHHTFCPDEIFAQTLCWNSPFRKMVYSFDDEGRSCVRVIKWVNNEVLCWSKDEIGQLIKSEAMFARKFSSRE